MTRTTTDILRQAPPDVTGSGPGADLSHRCRPVSWQPAEKPAAPGAATNPRQTYNVDDLVVDAARRTVSRNGADIRLGKLTFDLLILLIEESPGIVTKGRVAEQLWKRRHVSQETVRQRVKLLRKALNDDPARPRYVKVVRGQGYRLIPAANRAKLHRKSARHRNLQIAIPILLALIALADVTVSDDPMVATDSRLAVTPGNTMAVLPFENLSANSADSVFLNGLHNDLLTRLARQQSLQVQSRASVLKYRNTKKDSRAIGTELNVATILTGSIQRSGSAVRINVRLIDAHSEKHIWAEIYDRQLNPENLISLQSEVTTAIVAALNRKLTMMKADAQISPSKT